MLIKEEWVNRSEGYRVGNSGLYEPFTEDLGTLYRALQKEYGRCESKVYVDGPNGEAIPVGWVFIQRAKYEDTHEPYLKETWVTLYEKPDTVTREHHYHALEA